MTIDDYQGKIADIARRLDESRLGAWDALQEFYRQKTGPVWEAVEWRKLQLIAADIALAEDYLPIGFLTEADRDTRLTFFVVAFEVGKELQWFNCLRTCEPYRQDHPIFTQKPALWQELRTRISGGRDLELLSLARLHQHLDTELFEFDGRYLQLSSRIPPSLVSWMRQRFPGLPTYARFNPYVCKLDRIVRLDCEMIRPPNPGWWGSVNLHRRETDGGSFVLQDCAVTPETLERHLEFHSQGLRKLQFSAIRRNNQNLSMMIEELAIDGAVLVGRMIHLDTDCAPGTPADRCPLNHLDLAINFYHGSKVNARLGQDLANGGKVVDASQRIHLFRIEGSPLSSMFDCADSFFRSTVLKNEFRASLTSTT